MPAAALPLVVASEEVLRELPMPAEAYGFIALGFFGVLLGILWSFRNTAQKLRAPEGHGQHAHGDSGGQH